MLKYLFDVEFTDGSVYTQNAEDRSILEPEKRSCFYDVLKYVEEGRIIKTFMISDGHHVYMVDLRDGSFIVNGGIFKAHEEETLTNFRLIYFRQHTHKFNVKHDELAHDIVFRVGWQANDKDGNNMQCVLEIE